MKMHLLFLLFTMGMTFSISSAYAKSIDIVTQAGGIHHFDVDVAANVQQRANGLKWVQQMKDGYGMLFVFPRARISAFWMKDTLVPLDMLFIDEEGRIGNIHAQALPQDKTPISSKVLTKYVLEIGGGQTEKLNISEGDRVIFKDSLKGLEIQ